MRVEAAGVADAPESLFGLLQPMAPAGGHWLLCSRTRARPTTS